jgi:nucleotide-binding universal stress UspA family protein
MNGTANGRTPAPVEDGPASGPATATALEPCRPSAAFRTVLVPVDGGALAEHALPFALAIARRAGAAVRVAHVHCPTLPAEPRQLLDYEHGPDAALRRERKAYLNDLCRRISDVSPVPVAPVFVHGRDVAESLAAAAGTGADLVVMATRGRSRLRRVWRRSVADAVRRRLSVPLLLVRGADVPADLAAEPPLRRVLIPLDGSAFAERVIGPAVALGRLTDAQHTLLRVVPLEVDYSLGYSALGHSPPNRRLQAEARNYLGRLADEWRGRGTRVRSRVLLDDGPTADAIVGCAESDAADLIAMTTRGQGRLARLLWGSITDRVLRKAAVPVLVYRPDAGRE